ncbi:MAG: SDR family oxidoreductase [Rubrivivax sp.]|nr:SDR family oxidoreductase [Rubrivivax sp.]
METRPVVIVTGAARRIGRAIALELAAHGWDVAVHHRDSADDAQATAAELRALGARAQVFAADLADETACRALLPAVAAALGGVQAVVNNASVFAYDSVADFSYAAMERHWRANTAPAIVLAHALHAHLASAGDRGCVVNLLDHKLWNPNPDYLSYTLSKAALHSATTLLAQALAPAVRVCGVAPGLILGSADLPAADVERLQRQAPLQRATSPQDIARAVRYLLESPAITGYSLLVDGGQHLQPMARDFIFHPSTTSDR